MQLQDALLLINARGLSGEAARSLAFESPRGPAGPVGDPADATARLRDLLHLRGLGQWTGRAVTWPAAARVRWLAARLRASGVRVVWRGAPGYPEKLSLRLGDEAPPWLLVAGDESRLIRPACALVGSRLTPQPLLDAARRLAHALAGCGVAVVSGLAAGADRAAHEGALSAGPAGAGTVAIPARGLLRIDLSDCGLRSADRGLNHPSPTRESQIRDSPSAIRSAENPIPNPVSSIRNPMTCLGIGRPDEPFHAGLAIRRNTLIAAMAEGLVLVASELKGGSSYAVRWALAHGWPLWCFEFGRATPPANRHLIRSGLAEPLPLAESPEHWLDRLRPRLRPPASSTTPQRRATQLDWIRGEVDVRG